MNIQFNNKNSKYIIINLKFNTDIYLIFKYKFYQHNFCNTLNDFIKSSLDKYNSELNWIYYIHSINKEYIRIFITILDKTYANMDVFNLIYINNSSLINKKIIIDIHKIYKYINNTEFYIFINKLVTNNKNINLNSNLKNNLKNNLNCNLIENLKINIADSIITDYLDNKSFESIKSFNEKTIIFNSIGLSGVSKTTFKHELNKIKLYNNYSINDFNGIVFLNIGEIKIKEFNNYDWILLNNCINKNNSKLIIKQKDNKNIICIINKFLEYILN
jgi:hypothetical protein